MSESEVPLIVFLTLLTIYIIATANKQPHSEFLQQLDTNADGQICQIEALANKTLADQFHTLDANENGVVELEELAAIPFESSMFNG